MPYAKAYVGRGVPTLGRLMEKWTEKVDDLKRDTYVLYLAYRDPRTPPLTKLIGAAVIGYALCPIDLVPDFVPILDLIDDMVLVPAGMALAFRSIPDDVIRDLRRRSTEGPPATRARWIMSALVALIWLLATLLILSLLLRSFR